MSRCTNDYSKHGMNQTTSFNGVPIIHNDSEVKTQILNDYK